MWISLNWLRKLADFPEVNIREFSNRVTMSIAEVEGFKQTHPHLSQVYSAKILEIAKIPETDHLQVTKIDTGKEVLQVVCGAPNIEVGDIIPLAKVGTVLPLEGDKTLKIKKGKLKGVESFGMLCSAKELKLSNDHGGIMKLDKDTPLDLPLSTILETSDTLLEIDNKSITHRPDLWGHLGFAREVAAVLNGKLKPNYYHDKFTNDYSAKKEEVKLKVEIQTPDVCRRYNGIVIKNIEIKDSPEWMQRALIDMGLNPINNIVDMTNFVMMELGQPMHAFDLKKLASPEIIVRYAKNGEKIKTLDEQEKTLLDTHLVIADKEKAIAIAGVMGGDNTKIDENTTEIVLESANFHAATIRRAANKLGIRTDSSNRFEKSQDPENTINAIELAYYLIKETSPNAYIASDLADNYPTKLDTLYIDFKYSDIRNKLGLSLNELSDSDIKNILTNLYFEFTEPTDSTEDNTNLPFDNESSVKIKVPSFRATKDVSIKADIVEEIGRIYGYDNIIPKPFLSEVKPPVMNQERLFERKLKNLFVNKYDFNEVYNYSFVNEDDIKAFNENPNDYLGLRNYLSTEYTKIRRNLYISALKTAKVNAKNFSEFKFFEVGRGYHLEEKTKDNLATEHRYLLAGKYVQNSDESKDAFYDFKGIINDLFKTLNFKGVMPFIPNNNKSFAHPYRALEYKRGRDIFASIDEFDPRFLNKNGVNGRLVVLNIDLNKLYKAKKSVIKFSDLQKYPYTNFEITIIANKRDLINDIFEIAKKTARKLLKDIELLTIYEGHPIEEDKKAVSIKITLGDDNRTLKSKEIDNTLDNIVAALDKKGFKLKN